MDICSLIVAIFLMLRHLGLYDTLLGVILVKSSLEMPQHKKDGQRNLR